MNKTITQTIVLTLGLLLLTGLSMGVTPLPTPVVLDFTRLVPGFGPDSLPVFNGLNPKGEVPGEQFTDLGVHFECGFRAACFASDQLSYTQAHGGDFEGDPGPGSVFVQLTTVPANKKPGGILYIDFDFDVQVQELTVADSDATVTGGVTVLALNEKGRIIQAKELAVPVQTMHFLARNIRHVFIMDTGADGAVLTRLKFVKTAE